MTKQKLTLRINGRKIGPGNPCFIIAEISANHHQNYREAVELIRAAARTGVDAVKLQTYTPDTITINLRNKHFLVKGKNLPKEEREKEGVFVFQAEKAVFRPVKTGIMGEMNIEVISGLKAGDEIVTGTYQTLRELKDGDKVRIKKEEKKEKKEE